MKGKAITVFAVVFAVLVTLSMPVTAANTAVVSGGSHTSDSDFQNATLTNMTVSQAAGLNQNK